MTDRRHRQLLADLVRAKYPRECKSGIGPRPGVPVVLATDVATWLHANEPPRQSLTTKTYAELFEGPLELAPPMYNEFWVEAENPAPENRPEGYRVGVHVLSERDEDGWWAVETFGYFENPHGVHRPEMGLVYEVSPDGKVIAAPRLKDATDGFEVAWTVLLPPWAKDLKVDEDFVKTYADHMAETPTGSVAIKVRDDSMQHRAQSRLATAHTDLDGRIKDIPWSQIAIAMSGLVIATCAFAVCRNVEEVPVELPLKVRRKRAAALGLSEPLDAVSRITLPWSAQRASHGRLGATAGQQTLPAHLVRAHPKTYKRRDDGTGGLGKYHAEGTWLWAPQVRGNPERGSRVPEVTVKPAEEGLS